ncbi:carbohydrate-binding module family 1 protein [Botryobasidium botryosum FD-172 SS1]|uniref:AA9 family lytic polysaccharide monooxygenase n=1 Tax=Botryobasidium botryosum (strain FD-172 SS1) TaxID=930990 RepID=A0A067M4W5_BOTB1|nr:carbohydrate-binding module family 1 protein [Botryobasidium botryosum FD-172 SS1]
MLACIILSSLLIASAAHAHATFQDLWVNSEDQAGTCVRTPINNSPVTSVTDPNLACNAGGTKPAISNCKVPAGAKVTVEMHQQPGDRSCSEEAIASSHHGPVIVYMAKVADASTAVGSTANWFKIAQTGLISATPSPGTWGTDQLISNCGKMDIAVPSDIPAGDYLLRAEVIALHAAGSVGGAQFYMSCYQLSVTGGGTASPSTVNIPGAYSANDPGILFNLYTSFTNYTVPGPPVYGGGSTSGSGGSGYPTPAPGPLSRGPLTITPTMAATTSTTSASFGVAAAVQSAAGRYQQCGGIGYSGPTACANSYKCTRANDYYSQCA